jgi:lipopolysaccharide assembly outer membrane protein LptD (OstA)
MFQPVLVVFAAVVALVVPAVAHAQSNPLGSCKSTIRPQGSTPTEIPDRPGALRWTFVGEPVVITCDDTVLQALTIIVDDDTQDLEAVGAVVLQQGDLRIAAERATMNLKTKLGVFHNANGIARIGDTPDQKSQFGTQESDVAFWGERIERIALQKYTIHRGGFTTCAQPTPRWELTMGDATITLDHYAWLRNVVLRVKDVPLFYLPAFYYPINKEDRSTGFLLPTWGSSTLRGGTLSNAFFVAISRSQDATLFHDWTSKFGQGVGGEYRYVQSPGSRGTINFYMNDNPDQLDAGGAVISAGSRSYQMDGDINQALPRGFRLIGRMNYFTDIATQQLYQDVYESDQRQRRDVTATLSGNILKTRVTVSAQQRDYFYSRGGTQGRQRNGRMPSVNLNIPDRAIGSSRIYLGGQGQVAYLVDQDDLGDPTTNQSLWRFDGGPSIRAPLSNLSFLSATADASWRITHWGESLDLTDPDDPRQVGVALTRQLFSLETSVTGPVLARVFPTKGIKHVIEPRFAVSRTTSFTDRDRVVQIDGVDQIVGGNTSINYGLINRLLVRGPSPAPGRPGSAREVLSVSLTQSYYTDALASLFDSNYASSLDSAASNFSPLSVRASFRPTTEATADFRMEIDAEHRAVRTMSATARMNSAYQEGSIEWSRRFVIPGLRSFSSPRHFLSAGTLLRSRNNHLGGSYRFTFDAVDGTFVQQRVMAYYNSQCCGISVDWQTMETPLWTPQGVPTNTQFAVSVTLAGIGSFSNPLGSFGGR